MAGRSKTPRRRWSETFKKRVVAEASEPGATVAQIARRYDLDARRVSNWMKKFGSGTALIPIEITSESGGMAPLASFHTHGSHSSDYDSEVPSLTDIQSDISSQTDGYVSTPGGRFWHIDWRKQRAQMVCGEGCLPQDPNYTPCPADALAQQYTLADLNRRARQPVRQC